MEVLMRFIQACLIIGLSGWASYAVLTDGLPEGDNGSPKTRALRSLVTAATESFGTTQTALAILGAGMILVLVVLRRRAA